MDRVLQAARDALACCRTIAQFSDEPPGTTRTFLSPATREVHAYLTAWMKERGLCTRIDPAGNLRAVLDRGGPRILIGSHIDTVRNAGAFDGVLGVALGGALASLLHDIGPGWSLEVVGFSEEEGVRFGAPFLGSRALIGEAEGMLPLSDSNGISAGEALREYGLDPDRLAEATASADTAAYLEIHIEQGPVLEQAGLAIGVVDTIAGQSRYDVTFEGCTNHAGTTPMHLRRDALAGAAEWISSVEAGALRTAGLFATVGFLDLRPNIRNAINGTVTASLDVRHASDTVRKEAVERLLACAADICVRRKLRWSAALKLDQAAVPMDAGLTRKLAMAVAASGHPVHLMPSGAGHDAMIVARRIPSAMLFVRSPGGVSHSPEESVREEDVAAALLASLEFLKIWSTDV